MDKPNAPVPTREDQEQRDTSAGANPAPNLGFGGAVEHNAGFPPLLNTYAAAAAAIAMAKQQMAHSLQSNIAGSSQQTNVAFTPQTNTKPNAQQGTQKAAETQTNSMAAANIAADVTTQNAQQAATVNAVQQLAFPFPPQHFAAALLGGGLLPLANQSPAPPQRNNTIQQQLANSNVFNNGNAISNQPPTKAAPVMPTPQANANANAARAQNTRNVAAAAAQVVAAHAASGVMANAVFANMQNWKLGQLESHVQLLRDTSQPIPQPVALLLADARGKEDKRTAKRAANRKSACSSRARKKALVEEMTKANARLRRQAMILALLPDLVIAITVEGKITFCSAQVERVLRHRVPHLVGANFADILTPSSREKLRQLVKELLAAEQAATLGAGAIAALPSAKPSTDADNGPSSGRDISSGAEVNPVSDGSFPLAVVDVANGPISAEDNSDLSASNGGGKALNPAGPARLSSTSTFGNCGDDDVTAPRVNSPKGVTVEASDVAQVKSDVSSGSGSNQRVQAQPSSDDSLSSSNDVKNLREANEALGRNVRWHNEKLEKEGKAGKKKPSHKDDVTGESVTANNASARLSSLQVRSEPSADKEASRKRKVTRYDSLEEQSSSSSSDLMLDAIDKDKSRKNGIENSSEDSGYRESNQSVEDFSADDDSSSLRNGPRPKPLAPACNICLIRDDLTTIWCEVTSSIRTRSLKDENCDERLGPLEAKALSSNATQSVDVSKTEDEDSSGKGEIKELLLCLRPIRDGDETVDETLRFVPPKNVDLSDSGPSSSSTSVDGAAKDVGGKVKHRPPKKRRIVSDPSSSSLSNDSSRKLSKKPRLDEIVTEESAVESLMLMGNIAK